RVASDSPDGDDAVSFDGHISVKPRIARAIDDFPMADDQVIFRPGRLKNDGAQRNEGTTRQPESRPEVHGITATACAGIRAFGKRLLRSEVCELCGLLRQVRLAFICG